MISTAVYYALVIAVRADYEAKSLGELIALAEAKPGDLSFASVGFGSTHHLAGALLETTAGIKMVHVPYRGDSLTVTALLGGEIPLIVGTPVLLAPQIESGAIRGLAVTSPARSKLLPNVPTADEAGVKGFDVRTWAGLLAPKGTPPAIIKRLNKAVLETLADPETKAALETAIGGEVQGSTPEEMRALIFPNRKMGRCDQRREYSAYLSGFGSVSASPARSRRIWCGSFEARRSQQANCRHPPCAQLRTGG